MDKYRQTDRQKKKMREREREKEREIERPARPTESSGIAITTAPRPTNSLCRTFAANALTRRERELCMRRKERGELRKRERGGRMGEGGRYREQSTATAILQTFGAISIKI